MPDLLKQHWLINFKIVDFFFWESDWEKEAIYHPDFEKYYYTDIWYHEKLLNKKYWLVLWKKWTWKSILWRYFNNLIKNKGWISEIISYRDFRYNILTWFDDSDVKPNQFISIWKFILLLRLAKVILNDQSVAWETEFIDLDDFIKRNFDLWLDQNLLMERIIEKGVWFDKWLSANAKSATKEIRATYIYYISKLEETIITLISKSNNNYSLILDDLDDRFRRNDENKDAIISLIKAVNYINLEIVKRTNSDSKIVVLLRTDIFSYLNDPDLNKIKSVNSIVINWWTKVEQHSELFKMLIHKIRQSHSVLSALNDSQIFSAIFPQSVFAWPNQSIPPYKFILERTFFRPRDVISFIKLIVEKYPHTKYIGYKALQDVEKSYSEYFLNEIENELIWHLSDSDIRSTFNLLRNFRKDKFYFEDLKKYHLLNESMFQLSEKLDVIISLFFEFWIIWNFYEVSWLPYYKSIIRDEEAIVNFDYQFVLHLWLRKAIL